MWRNVKKLWEKVMMKNSNSFMGEEMRKVLICVTLLTDPPLL